MLGTTCEHSASETGGKVSQASFPDSCGFTPPSSMLDTSSNLVISANQDAGEFSPEAFLNHLRSWEQADGKQQCSFLAPSDRKAVVHLGYSNHRGLVSEGLESMGAAPQENLNERLSRALDLIEKMRSYDDILPWLWSLSEHEDQRVRSKAVKLLCKAKPKKRIIERLLKSDDARVRANVIEALWFFQTSDAASVFRSALSDPHHRVVVNALIGLYHQHDAVAMEQLIGLSAHPSQMFRRAALWAFLYLHDERAIEPLKSLVQDPSQIVREKAHTTLAKLLYVPDWAARPTKHTSALLYCS
jgi:hypothetical protein